MVGARFRKSARGNDTIQVTYEIEGVSPSHDRVAEYFVLQGGKDSKERRDPPPGATPAAPVAFAVIRSLSGSS